MKTFLGFFGIESTTPPKKGGTDPACAFGAWWKLKNARPSRVNTLENESNNFHQNERLSHGLPHIGTQI